VVAQLQDQGEQNCDVGQAADRYLDSNIGAVNPSGTLDLSIVGQVREALDNLAGWLRIEVGLSRPLRVSYS
jgi:hypothetical protein